MKLEQYEFPELLTAVMTYIQCLTTVYEELKPFFPRICYIMNNNIIQYQDKTQQIKVTWQNHINMINHTKTHNSIEFLYTVEICSELYDILRFMDTLWRDICFAFSYVKISIEINSKMKKRELNFISLNCQKKKFIELMLKDVYDSYYYPNLLLNKWKERNSNNMATFELVNSATYGVFVMNIQVFPSIQSCAEDKTIIINKELPPVKCKKASTIEIYVNLQDLFSCKSENNQLQLTNNNLDALFPIRCVWNLQSKSRGDIQVQVIYTPY